MFIVHNGKRRSKRVGQKSAALEVAQKIEAMMVLGEYSIESQPETNEILFHRNGKHMEQNYIRRIFKRVLAKAGIREVRLHDIRHTYASLLLSMGQSPVYVMEQLGHSGINITVDIYGHLIPSSNRQAVNSLETPHPSAPYTLPVKMERP